MEQPERVQQVNEQVTPSYVSQATENLVMFQLSNFDVIEKIKYALLGYEVIEGDDGKLIAKKLGDQVLSDKGINIILFTLNGMAHKGIFLSNLDSNDAHKLTYAVAQRINDVLYEREKEIGVDPAYKAQIINIVDVNVYASLRRPVNQGERAFLSKTTERKEIVTQKDRQEKTGIRRVLSWLS